MAVACGLQLRLQTFWGWANGMMVTGTVGWKTSEQLPLGIRLSIFSVVFENECKQYILHTYSMYFLARKRMASGKSSRGSFFVALLRTKGWTPKTMIRNPCPNEKWLEKADFLSFLVAKWWAWTGMNHTAPLFIDPVKCLKCAQLHLKSILHQHMTSKQCIWKGASHIHQLHARIALTFDFPCVKPLVKEIWELRTSWTNSNTNKSCKKKQFFSHQDFQELSYASVFTKWSRSRVDI